MLAIDHHAWTNRWRHWHPAEKAAPAFGLLLCTLFLPPLTTAPLVLTATGLATIYGAGIPWRSLAAVLAAPATFLLAGVPFLAISLDFSQGFALEFSAAGWNLAVNTVGRALAAVSCLAFLTLTTPVADWAPLLRRIRVPASVIELILLMYRLIFIFAERALTGQRAQTARLGYSRFDRSLRSLGWLAGNLFQRALAQAKRLETGLLARGYHGELRVLEPVRSLSWRRLGLSLFGVGSIGLASRLLDSHFS